MATRANDYRKFIEKWNLKYPLDRWYRNKFNIPFGSKQHRELDLVQIRLEFEEYLLFNELLSQPVPDDSYTPGRGQWLNKHADKPVSQEEIEDLYDNLDLNDIKVNDDGSLLI